LPESTSKLCHAQTHGAFDINGPDGPDPSGIVKSWAAQTAFAWAGIEHGYLNAGGDIVLAGPTAAGASASATPPILAAC